MKARRKLEGRSKPFPEDVEGSKCDLYNGQGEGRRARDKTEGKQVCMHG